MKCLLLPCLLLGAVPATHAQKLPVPGEKNTDWTLLTSKTQRTQFGSIPRMPNAMSNTVGSMGNRHFIWDAERQLRYQWNSPPISPAPTDSVTVYEYATGTIYSYHRNGPPAKPRQWRHLD